jgi:hypothetical protein
MVRADAGPKVMSYCVRFWSLAAGIANLYLRKLCPERICAEIKQGVIVLVPGVYSHVSLRSNY